jgi:bifunctional non-homologous end joining protein LigD
MAIAEKTIVSVEGREITVSKPDKLLWPDAGITKLLYLEKLLELSPYLLPYCQNRYLTTIRYPHGVNGTFFYQKNCPEPIPEFVATSMLDDIKYINLNSISTLLWLGNLACLEFHASFHYIGVSYPAEWVIDIDPSLEVEPRIMQAAHLIGEILDSLHISSIPKTSGATGVQIVVPVPQHRYSFEQLRNIGAFIAEFAVRKHPKLFTIERFKKNRGDLIYIDYLQHWYGKTISAPYTPRAKAAASVSTPLTWSEVEEGCDPRDFNLRTIGARLQDKGDLLRSVPPQNLDHILAGLLSK